MATKIQWCDETWNPVTGCKEVSEGCRNCYARTLAKRLQAMGVAKYANGFDVTFHPECLNEPGQWGKGKRVFVSSMSDLFQREVTDKMRDKILAAMARYPHTYLLLTKRVRAMGDYIAKAMYDEECTYQGWYEQLGELGIEDADPPTIWVGASVEDQKSANKRIEDLLTVPAAKLFVSIEPLLERVSLAEYMYGLRPPRAWLQKIDWVILGCESGPMRRPCPWDWARSVRDQCVAAGIPFFLKQLAENEDGSGKVIHMPELDGRVWAEIPTPAIAAGKGESHG